MKSPLEIGIIGFDKQHLPPAIMDILSNLSQRRNVLGAVLVKGDMGIVACDLPTEGHETSDIVDVLAMMENWGAYPRRIPRNSLFPQLVREGPGFKIFAKRMSGDLTLFVMMRSAGYIGPATQDIKETIERIKGEMDVTSSE